MHSTLTAGHPFREPMAEPSLDFSIDALSQSMSRMLLRGDQYPVDSRISAITLKESWGWPEDSDTRYLDASCLLFDERRQLLGTVDFSSRFGSTEVGGEDAVEHSGDVLQSHLLEGNHTLHVNLERLEPCVKEVFVTLSAWGDMYLGDILNPAVKLVETYTSRPLCHYELVDVPRDSLQRYSSVIMCRIYRRRSGFGEESWAVEALGQLGMGNAADYTPMVNFIQQGLGLSDAMSTWRM